MAWVSVLGKAARKRERILRGSVGRVRCGSEVLAGGDSTANRASSRAVGRVQLCREGVGYAARSMRGGAGVVGRARGVGRATEQAELRLPGRRQDARRGRGQLGSGGGPRGAPDWPGFLQPVVMGNWTVVVGIGLLGRASNTGRPCCTSLGLRLKWTEQPPPFDTETNLVCHPYAVPYASV